MDDNFKKVENKNKNCNAICKQAISWITLIALIVTAAVLPNDGSKCDNAAKYWIISFCGFQLFWSFMSVANWKKMFGCCCGLKSRLKSKLVFHSLMSVVYIAAIVYGTIIYFSNSYECKQAESLNALPIIMLVLLILGYIFMGILTLMLLAVSCACCLLCCGLSVVADVLKAQMYANLMPTEEPEEGEAELTMKE